VKEGGEGSVGPIAHLWWGDPGDCCSDGCWCGSLFSETETLPAVLVACLSVVLQDCCTFSVLC